MDRIAELAGVSKPMLYAYFGSKEGLYVAYIERNGRELVQRLVGADRPAAPHAERLRALVAEFLAYVEEHGDGWTVLFHEFNANRPLVDVVAGLRDRIANEIARMLQSGSAGWTGLRSPASEGVAHAIVGAGESLANWWLEHPEEPKERVAALLMNLAAANSVT